MTKRVTHTNGPDDGLALNTHLDTEKERSSVAERFGLGLTPGQKAAETRKRTRKGRRPRAIAEAETQLTLVLAQAEAKLATELVNLAAAQAQVNIAKSDVAAMKYALSVLVGPSQPRRDDPFV